MCIETTVPTQRTTATVPLPPTHPRLPIIAFGCDDERPFAVYYSAVKAAQAAFDQPDGEFLDLRGAVVALVTEDDGSSRLVAAHSGDEAALRERLLCALRETAERAACGESLPAHVKAFLRWLAAAPCVADLVHALGLAETEDPGLLSGRYCHDKCTTAQRAAGKAGCCPG